MLHEITLKGYTATPADGGFSIMLGTESSYGTEQIKVIPGDGWDGLTITATFHPPFGEPVSVLVENGLVDVPWEATAACSQRYSLKGRIVFSGVSTGVQRITRDLVYYVADHAPVDGQQSQPTPSWYERMISMLRDVVPAGGTAGQVLAKASDTDYDAAWVDMSGAVSKIVGTSDNHIIFRDLEPGVYLVQGRCKPHIGATMTMIASQPVLACVYKDSTASYVQIFYPKNNQIQYFVCKDDSYESKYYSIPSMWDKISKVYEPIETLEIDTSDTTSLNLTGFALDAFVLYMYSPAGSSAFSWYASAFQNGVQVGTANLSNMTNTASRYSTLYCRNEHGIYIMENTVVGTSNVYTGSLNRAPGYSPVNAPIDKIYVYTLAGKPFPVGSKFELYGIKAN